MSLISFYTSNVPPTFGTFISRQSSTETNSFLPQWKKSVVFFIPPTRETGFYHFHTSIHKRVIFTSWQAPKSCPDVENLSSFYVSASTEMLPKRIFRSFYVSAPKCCFYVSASTEMLPELSFEFFTSRQVPKCCPNFEDLSSLLRLDKYRILRIFRAFYVSASPRLDNTAYQLLATFFKKIYSVGKSE
jgi:hypothetical protein